MPAQNDYQLQRYQKNVIKLRNLLEELPEFCRDYFRGIEPSSSILTRVNYAYDLRLFFNFLVNEVEKFKGIPVKEFTLEHLEQVRSEDIEYFLEYISSYQRFDNENCIMENHQNGKARKLAAIRSMYRYFQKHKKIKNNETLLVDTPKIYEKAIIRLEPDEVANLLDAVEYGEGLSEKQIQYHKKTKKRDLAILMLFLGTGIRISELVGLNITDLDFDNNAFRVVRKGGNETILYFGDEVREALLSYLEERRAMTPAPGHENALFLSLQNKRISTYAVENLVKKYAKIIAPLKKISPHKLRSTYGTTLYQETGDIYLVADVLGHKSVETTRKHYSAMDEERRKMAARTVSLRK